MQVPSLLNRRYSRAFSPTVSSPAAHAAGTGAGALDPSELAPCSASPPPGWISVTTTFPQEMGTLASPATGIGAERSLTLPACPPASPPSVADEVSWIHALVDDATVVTLVLTSTGLRTTPPSGSA